MAGGAAAEHIGDGRRPQWQNPGAERAYIWMEFNARRFSLDQTVEPAPGGIRGCRWLPPEAKRLPQESQAVWGALTPALKAQDWATARGAKTSVEQHQRELRAARQRAEEVWVPSCFERGEAGWVVKEGVMETVLADTQA